MNPHMIMARRRAGIHPGFVRAVQAKPECPPEIYAYPATARREAALKWRPLTVPTVSQVTTPAPSIGWSRAAYAIALLALWAVAANVAPGV